MTEIEEYHARRAAMADAIPPDGFERLCATYSADLIADSRSRVSGYLLFLGERWVCTGTGPDGQGGRIANAYRLTPAARWEGETTTYHDADPTHRRGDPNGFYHGMLIHHGKTPYVLTGPERLFIAAPASALEAALAEVEPANRADAEHLRSIEHEWSKVPGLPLVFGQPHHKRKRSHEPQRSLFDDAEGLPLTATQGTNRRTD